MAHVIEKRVKAVAQENLAVARSEFPGGDPQRATLPLGRLPPAVRCDVYLPQLIMDALNPPCLARQQDDWARSLRGEDRAQLLNEKDLERAQELANVCLIHAHGVRTLKPLHELNEAIRMHLQKNKRTRA